MENTFFETPFFSSKNQVSSQKINNPQGVAGGILYKWRTQDIVLTAVLCLLWGIFFIAWHPLHKQLTLWMRGGAVFLWGTRAVKWPLQEVFMGLWFGAGVMVPYVIRKPGAAFVAEVVAALIEVPFNSHALLVLGSGVVQGAASEVPFLLTHYQNYRWPVLFLAGGLPAFTSLAYEYATGRYHLLGHQIWIWMIFLRFLSGAFLTGGGVTLLTKNLAKTGIFANYPVGKPYVTTV